MAVPKRLLKRAVDRNGLRRVAREAWRAGPAAAGCPGYLLRLTARPADFSTMSRAQRKRYWRAELDDLFARIGTTARG